MTTEEQRTKQFWIGGIPTNPSIPAFSYWVLVEYNLTDMNSRALGVRYKHTDDVEQIINLEMSQRPQMYDNREHCEQLFHNPTK